MLERVFEIVLNMSITASVAAVLIILFRLLLGNKLPKIFSYALWAIVLLRLFVPFYLPSKMSLFNAVRIPDSIIAQSGENQKTLDNALPAADNKDILQKNTAAADLNSSLPVKATKNPIEFKPELIIVALWLSGAAGLLLFSAIAYIRASKRLKDAVLYKNDELLNNLCMKLKLGKKVRIYTSDRIDSPIVYGLARAAVILPLSLSQSLNESELRHIIAHELVHIKRFDHIIKPLSVLALCIHWFNPLVWISFALSQKDMETACDEKVMSSFDNDIRSEYAGSLIKLASRQNLLLNGGVLAFGESNIKRRVKSIMNYKKPSFWIVIVMVAILTASSFALLTNGESKSADKNETTPKSLNTKTKPDYGNETIKKTSEQIQATRKTIDKLLSIITSPSASSSTGDYIKAYQKEADQIVDMGEKALPYLTEILDSGDKGLRGNVVWQLCERIIKNLSGNIQSPETEKLLKETITAVDKWKVSMGYDKVSDAKATLPEFSKEEVAAARAVVKEYFHAIAVKDDKAILATLNPRMKSGKTVLYGKEQRTLTKIEYDSQDMTRKNYRPTNYNITDENIIVFRVSFNVQYPKGYSGSWNEGMYENYNMILVRNDKNSPWLIYDMGY